MTGPRHRAAPPPPPPPPPPPAHPPPPAPTPEELLPCPCCGHRTLGELWAYEICPVCYWEEDPFQLRHPTAGTGPNHGLSLIEAQANYRRLGAVTEEMRRYVRPPREDEPLDPGFRPADPDRDPFEQGPAGTPMPDDLTGLYYWRTTYWRRHLAP